MKTTVINYFPPSQPGQLLRERRGPGNIVHRELVSACANPKSLLCPGTAVWTARHGGWVRLT